MATLSDWQKYMNLLHEHALVEDDLREEAKEGNFYCVRILFERFGVDL